MGPPRRQTAPRYNLPQHLPQSRTSHPKRPQPPCRGAAPRFLGAVERGPLGDEHARARQRLLGGVERADVGIENRPVQPVRGHELDVREHPAARSGHAAGLTSAFEDYLLTMQKAPNLTRTTSRPSSSSVPPRSSGPAATIFALDRLGRAARPVTAALALASLGLWAACSARTTASPNMAPRRPPPAPTVPSALPYARPQPRPATPCPNVAETTVVGEVAPPWLNEVSGLAASLQNPGTLWAHNDSGDDAFVYAIEEGGASQARVLLEGAAARDWEDLALAPCPTSETSCLYVADIGDNLLQRESVQVYWAQEPSLHRARGLDFSIPARRVDIQYEDGPKDAETLLADPISGDLFVVEKGPLLSPNATVGVYRIARAELERGTSLARRVGSLPMGPTTAGDVLEDGSGIMIRSYHRLRYWPREPHDPLELALREGGCELLLADLGEQGEAIAFLPQGRGYVTIAEGDHAPIHVYTFAAPSASGSPPGSNP